MNVASCGLGVNSIAGIMEASDQGIVFDEILFANTGRGKQLGERAVTYEYLYKWFNPWLKKNGQPMVKMLHSYNKDGDLITLYDECYKLQTLPAIVFGWKTCSQRFKGLPQDKFLNIHPKAIDAWKSECKVTKWIFYDADEPSRAKDYSDSKFDVRYFLLEQDWGRYECENKIIEEGLPLPPKSSCKFCPSMKPYQIVNLYQTEIMGFYEAIELERNALRGGKMTEVKGLGRDYSWWDLIVAYRYINLFKRSISKMPGKQIDKRVIKLVKKLNKSKAAELQPRIQKNQDSCDIVNYLFSNRIDLPCGCYDGH